jgi:hypothetical protein
MMLLVRRIYIYVMCVMSNGSPETKVSGPYEIAAEQQF